MGEAVNLCLQFQLHPDGHVSTVRVLDWAEPEGLDRAALLFLRWAVFAGLLLLGTLALPAGAREQVLLPLGSLLAGSLSLGWPARWAERMAIWQNPWETTDNDNRRVQEGKEHIARMLWVVSAGGFLGTGLGQALPPSCNCVLAQVGVKLGWHRLFDFANDCGFNESISLFLAQTAIGQYNVRVTPLQLALFAAAVANDGQMMHPTVLRSILDGRGTVLWHFQPKVFRTPLSSSTARYGREMMVQVVEAGTGTPARISGVAVAGKAGTPEEDVGSTNALFIGFAPAEEPQVAVAAVIEGGRGGGRTAGPIVKALLEEALQK